MTITIELAPDLERQIQQAATQAGLAPDAYILEAIRARLEQNQTTPASAPHLSETEADLLLKINHSLSSITWSHYHDLIAKRQAETLTPEEQQELIALTGRIEAANVQRISYLAELARLRNTTLDALMADLGLKPMTFHA
jgi:hypothetical protein